MPHNIIAAHVCDLYYKKSRGSDRKAPDTSIMDALIPPNTTDVFMLDTIGNVYYASLRSPSKEAVLIAPTDTFESEYDRRYKLFCVSCDDTKTELMVPPKQDGQPATVAFYRKTV